MPSGSKAPPVTAAAGEHCGPNNRLDSDTNTAGGGAIYRKLPSTSTAKILQVALSDTKRVIKNTGDVCLAEITCFNVDTPFKLVLGAVYIHSGTSTQNIGTLPYQALVPYVHNSQCVPPFLMDIDADVPILLCCNFNTNVTNDDTFLKYMKDTYNLECVSVESHSKKRNDRECLLAPRRRTKENCIRQRRRPKAGAGGLNVENFHPTDRSPPRADPSPSMGRQSYDTKELIYCFDDAPRAPRHSSALSSPK
ncbi:hypothetical protein EVAR_43345_1 [Eumeta japonica]|uniref:Uncharacterized protein n=1 Tax=Eumeta variegata TaxID=151549 RepID=A0A4C1WRW5_EUMVA|nr:hypothetical protein EVAR_43345_1 [Eumeta japonica]